jgi:hypothetical protein
MKEQNKRILFGLIAIVLLVALFSFGNKPDIKNVTNSQTQVITTESQTQKNLEEMKLKSASSDTVVDFFVNGLTDEELITATQNIDNSFTPYSFEASGVITTNF